MPFDPDAYLKKKPEQTTNPFKAEGFDPDAYLKQTPKPFDPDAYLGAKPAAPTQPSAPPEESGFLRQAADIPIGITKGMVTGVRMIADAFGAGSDASKLIKTYEDQIGGLLSAQAKNDQKEISRILKDAQDKGVLDQLAAAGKAFATAPIDLTVQALGTSAPALITGLATTIGGAPTAVALGTSALMGSVMGAGEAKGSIYEATKEELLNIKVPKAKAEQIAIAAQEYGGKNLDQILLAAGLGAATSATGFEASAIKGMTTRILSKAAVKETAEAAAKEVAEKGVQKGVARSIATGIGKESIPELLQGSQIQLAENLALQREGFDVPTMRGVVSQGALEALSGAPLGAYAGYRERGAPTVGEDTPEGRALSELDRLAAEEEKVARSFVERKLYAELGRPPLEEEILEGINAYFDEQVAGGGVEPGAGIAGVSDISEPEIPRRPADLTPQEISNIERRLYAELGRAPNEYEFEEGINDYLDEQNAGRGTKPGAGIAGVPDISEPEATGVPDTTVATTPESEGLDTTGGATTVAGAGTGAQPGALEEPLTMEAAGAAVKEAISLEGNQYTFTRSFEDVGEEPIVRGVKATRLPDGKLVISSEGSNPSVLPANLAANITDEQAAQRYANYMFGEGFELGTAAPKEETAAPKSEEGIKAEDIKQVEAELETLKDVAESKKQALIKAEDEVRAAIKEYESTPQKSDDRSSPEYFKLNSASNAASAANEEYKAAARAVDKQYEKLSAARKEARKEETTGEKRDVSTYLEGYPQEVKRYNTYINSPEMGPLLQSANAAIQKLTDFINSRGFSVREVNRGTPDAEVQRAKDLASAVSGIAARLLTKQDAVDRKLQRANPEQLQQAKTELETFINDAVNNFLSSSQVEEQRREDEELPPGAFKSVVPTPATYISPAVGIVPTNKFGINRLNKLYSDGKISAQEYADGMIKLYEELEDKAAKKPMTQGMGRKRGLGAVIQALEDAANKGRISQETAEFAKWLLLQNPAIAADLAISIKMPQTAFARESFEGVAGFYNDVARIVRIITRKGGDGKYLGTSSDVGVHEILHHMERMLPTDLRALIREEWKVRVQKAMDQAVKDNNKEVIKYLALVVNGNAAQSSGALQEAENMIKEGKVPLSYYGFINTSEFWAVNGANILAGRFEAKTGLQKLRQYVKEFIEKIKSIFGLETDDPIIRGLNAVLKGDGTFLQKKMLADSRGGQYSPSLDTSGKEQQLIEQFRRAGDLQPDVVKAILNNDLNGALNILANRLGGFYGELATKLASLNLQTSIAFDNGTDVANRAILATVGPQLQRITSYIRIADPDLYKRRFEGFEKPENLVSTSIGLTVLRTQNKHPVITSEINDAYNVYGKYMMVATAPGAYLNMFDTITLNTKLIEGIGNRVFLHEVVHAATVSILRADPSQLTKEQLAAREEIEKLYKLAQRNLKVGEYGLSNKFEFLAELFTNNDFRKLLKAIPYPPASTNVLSRFFNAILRLVGADNLASRAMVEAEKLFTSARYQETKPMGPLFAQAPKKRRVRGPISTPDTYRTAESQQNALKQTIKDAYEGRMPWADAVKIIGPSIWDSGNTILRKTALPVMNLTQLEDLTRTKFTQITGALKIIRDMVASRAKKMNTASEIMRDWTKAQKKNFAQSQLMGRIMMEATIRGIDPDTAPAGALNKPLQDAWNTLDNDFKIIYRRVRDFYANSVNEMVKEMERRASANPDPVARAKALKKIKEQFGPDKLIKPYFPLRRFGQYFYQVGEKNFKEFYEFEDPFTRDAAMRKRIKDLSAGNEQQRKLAASIQKGNGISELYGKNISTTQALKDVQDLIDNITATDTADLKEQLKDSLNQLIYILLPQQSVRKMFINRKSIQGASADMLRVFATTAVHSAYQQSRFMYSEKFLQNLNNARDEIINAQKMGMLSIDDAAMYKDFILEVEQRVPTIMSNEDTSMTAQVAGKASELTFYYMLSAPFTAMLNTIGAVQLAMPYIGGSYGYARANALLVKNMGRYLATSPTRTFSPLTKRDFAQVNFPSIAEGRKLPPLLQKAADRFIDDGVIDISLTNDIFELGERPSALYTGTSATIKKIMSGLFHQSERMNREIVLLTTFELAYDKFLNDYQRQPGMEGLRGVYLRDARGDKIKNTPDQAFELAIEEATRVTSTSLGDYSRQTKGRIFANPIMNLLLKFKQYPILAMYSIMRNFHVGIVAPFKKAEIDQYRALLEQELKNDPNKDKVIAQRLQEVEAQRKALEKEGRRRLAGILGVTTILGGVAASPFFSLVVGNLVKMFADDDDDEYFDWENWFYNYMEGEFGGYLGGMLANAGIEPKTAEKAGRKTAEAVSRGLPAAMGAAVADRVSLDPKALLWRDGRYSPDARENFIESLIANAGPVVGLALNFVDAYQLAKEGQYARAVEKAVPAIIAKPASAVRMAEEGATTKKGDVLIDDFTVTELAMQSIGLQPERLAQKQKAAIAIKQKEQKILDAREAIMDRLWMERDNPDGYEAAMERALEFNSKRKDPKMLITPKKIRESFKKRAQLKAEAETLGAKYDKRLRSELMDMGEFADDE